MARRCRSPRTSYARATEPRRPPITLPATQTNRGTGLRHHQKYSRIPTVFTPRHCQRRWRVEPFVYGAQYFEIGQSNAVRQRGRLTPMAWRSSNSSRHRPFRCRPLNVDFDVLISPVSTFCVDRPTFTTPGPLAGLLGQALKPATYLT